MRRIFYYSSNGIKVFLWQKKHLLSSVEFANDEQSKQAFAEYLKSSPAMVSHLLVDVIDEDFRRETIPHVNARDRKALIQRMVDRHYRDEKYHQVQRLGRSKTGRKDDNILLCSLSNAEKMTQWTQILEANQVAVSGIWSVPHLTLDLLKLSKISGDNVLLVTRELPWTQRESFFQKGKLLFSRLERLDVNLYASGDGQVSWQHLTEGAEQIKHFLTNQRIIGFTEKLNVACLSTHCNEPAIAQHGENNGQIQYQTIQQESVFKHLTSRSGSPLHSDGIFAWLCAQKPFYQDHYGTRQIKQNFMRYYAAQSFKSASYFAALFFISVAAFFALSALKTNREIVHTQQLTENLQQQYNRDFGSIADQLADAPLVQTSVQHADLLRAESRETPQKYFADLAVVYSEPRFKLLTLNDFSWTKHPRESIQQVVGQLIGGGDNSDEASQELVSPAATHYQALLRLGGELNREYLNYRNTVAVMADFVNSLAQLSVVHDIHLLKTPVDIRPKSKFSDKSGIDQENILKNSEADRYDILIVLEPPRGDSL